MFTHPIQLIQRNVPIGSEISVYSKSGKEFRGYLQNISPDHIVLRDASGKEMFLSEGMISGFEPHDSDNSPESPAAQQPQISPQQESSFATPLAPPNPVPQQPDFGHSPEFNSQASSPAPQQSTPSQAPISQLESQLASQNVSPPQTEALETAAPTVPEKFYPEVVKTRAIEIEIELKTNVQRSELKPIPPDFTLPAEITELPFSRKRDRMKGGWESIQGTFEYAEKVKDLSRLNQVIQKSQQYINLYPQLAIARYNLGCMYLKLEKLGEAIDAFESAAATASQQLPQAFHNIAAVAIAQQDETEAYFSLEDLFKQAAISDYIEAWYVYLKLITKFKVADGLASLYDQAIEQENSDNIRLLVDSAIYLLKRNGSANAAYQLTTDTLKSGRITADEFRSALYELDFSPDAALDRKQRGRKETLQTKEDSIETSIREKGAGGRIKMLLTNAERLARDNDYPAAVHEINKILELDSEHTIAVQKREEYRIAIRKQATPSGKGPYARGQYAKNIEGDNNKAKRLFRQAIREGDRSESAVKDLAQVYRQEGDTDKAIELLLMHRDNMKNKVPVDNLLSNMYETVGKYREAMRSLTIVLQNTPIEKQYNVLTKLSYFQYKLTQYHESEKTLERALEIEPEGETATILLAGLREAYQTGLYEALDKMFLEEGTQSFVETTLSNFLVFHLEQCEYAGVEATKIASKSFSEKDAYNLDELANQLSYRRPRDRAGYYLSAAKILVDLGQKAEERRPSIFLRNFCAAMGDACIAEQTDRAVARSYYAEAFLIAPEWANQLGVKLSQFVMLEYAPNEELLKPNPPQIEDALEAVFKMDIPKISTSVVKGLLDLSRLNSEILRFLMRWVYPNQEIREPLKAVCYEILGESGESSSDDESEFLSLWKRGQTLMQQLDQGVNADIAYLRSSSNNLDTLKAQIAEVQKLESKMLISLDRQRLSQVRQVLNSIYEYAQQQTYGEREYSATRIQNSINQTIEGIEKNPTKYSWELFRPYLVALSERIEEHFNEIKRAAEPEELRTELAIESLPNQSEIECQITITNEQGKSPANTVVVSLEDSPDNDYTFSQRDIPATETLSGGTSVTCRIPLSVVSKAQEAQLFTLYYKLSYSTRTQSKIESRGALAVPLYSATDFQEIHNPYATYAQGTAVTEETMFYGRDQMLKNIISAIKQPAAPRSFVIYGQKRVGKSSLLYHLENKMNFPFIPVSFSIGDISNNLSIASFLSRIIQKLEETFADMEDKGFPAMPIEGPSIESVQNNPELQFQDYMMKIQRFLTRDSQYKEARIILLIDEFSYIYSGIQKGNVPDTFMKFWKALLEKNYFGSILVGQDVMPKFIAAFSNEFQVANPIRVSYLESDEAEKLIVDPIRIPETKESRYRGSAIKKLLELTAGNPYYIQIFCDRLVQYMNRKSATYVTDADIKQVERQELLLGTQSLQSPQFDNLFSASEDVADGITSEDAEKVLREIARNSQNQDYCDRNTITAQTPSATVDAILADLCTREVLEKKGNLYQIRVKLLKEWLLLN